MTRRWHARLVVAAAAGFLASCGPGATDPGIPADTDGPLTREQAEALIEEPLSDLAEQLSAEVPAAEELTRSAPAAVSVEEGQCTFTSTTYRSQGRVDGDAWGDLADQVRPQMRAWLMDTGQLDAPERSSGAGLRGENPHNGARLQLHAWNGDEPDAVDGPALGLELSVRVPLTEADCA